MTTMQNSEDHIREVAYRLWEEDGRPDGRHEEHWARACAEVAREAARDGAMPRPSETRAGAAGIAASRAEPGAPASHRARAKGAARDGKAQPGN